MKQSTHNLEKNIFDQNFQYNFIDKRIFKFSVSTTQFSYIYKH
ncbi:hypothetical protein pb186bvf_002492 [Paramecium bursaria]